MKEKGFYYVIGIIIVVILLLCFLVFALNDSDDKKSDSEQINNTDSVKDKFHALDNVIMILEVIKNMDECDDVYKLELTYINYYMKSQIDNKSNYKSKENRKILALQKKLVVAIDDLLKEENKANIDKFKLVFKEYSKLVSKGGN